MNGSFEGIRMTLRILFASPYCLLDTTSGAAISVRELLTQLSQSGFTCEAVTASIFDPTREVLLDKALLNNGLATISRQGMVERTFFVEVTQDRLTHTILKTNSSQRLNLTSQEESGLLSLVEQKIATFQPDILLTYGGLSAERKIHALAHRNGIPVVFYLANSHYTRAETFSKVDLVLVPSKFLSEHYGRRLGLRSQVLRDIVTWERYMVNRKDSRFFTYINPTPQKGLTLFSQIATEALQKLPRAEFLVVEGRLTQAEAARMGIRFDRFANVKVIANQTDMRPVYAETRVLLYPSFSEEASGRSIVEAQLNGIPIVASQRGGIPENLNGGGFLIRIPDRCMRDYFAVPTQEEVQPWIDQLRLLIEDNEAYGEARERALQAAKDFIPEKIVQTAINLFQELLDKYPSKRIQERKLTNSDKRAKVEKMNKVSSVRYPAVAGKFYPGDKEELFRQVSELLELSAMSFVVPAIVVPHAGYIYSGRIAGKVYGQVHIPDHVIIIGPNHTGRGAKASVMAEGQWDTPIGRVPIDSRLAERLLSSCPLLERDVEAHRGEHSIEVQLPFLLSLNPGVSIVPVTLKMFSLDECLKLGRAIAEVIQQWPGKILLVASTDMTHYEPQEQSRSKDRLAIDQIIAMSPEGLYHTVERDRISMCGVIPTTVVLSACQALGVKRAQLVAYGDSAETTRDATRVVGYSGLIFRG
jgi:AmmeMemoRadiSam system protein B